MSDSTGTQAATPQQLQRSAALSAPGSDRTDTAGRYELRGEIARGGMGVVVRAWDNTLHREVAVKLLHPQMVGSHAEQQFLEEANITGQLQHPGIPPVYDLGTLADGRPFLAMKLVNGRTFDALLKESPADRGRWVGVFEGICQAVGYAHANGVIHRDLKPQNVMVGAFGEVQVMDWGLAKVLGRVEPSAPDAARVDTEVGSGDTPFHNPRGDSETAPGNAMGTPAYMPPEQARGDVANIDARSDVFGLGAILCAILTGKPPFAGSDGFSSYRQSAEGNLADAVARIAACGAEPELVALATRCLAANAAARPANGAEVATAVAALRADAERRAKQAEMDRARAEVQSAEQRKRQRVWAWSAAAVAVTLTAGLIASAILTSRAWAAEAATTNQLTLTKAAEADALTKKKKVEETLVIVERRTLFALDAFEDMVFGIQNKLADHPGTQDLRRELLKQARAGLETILDDAREQGTPDSTIVWSHFRMGDVERQLGDTAAAQREYETAHKLAQELADDDPDDPKAARDLAYSWGKLGDVARQTGRSQDALKHYERSLAIRQRLAGLDTINRQQQVDLALVYEKLGDVTRLLSQTQAAFDWYRKDYAITKRFADAEPDGEEVQNHLCVTLGKLGSIAFQMGRLDDAFDYHTQEATICQRLAAIDPKNTRYQRDLSISHEHLGDVALERNRTADALAHYQKSLVIGQKLADADPRNAATQRDLCVCLNKVGNASFDLGRPKDAQVYYQRALAVRVRLSTADPANAGLKRELMVSYNKVGDALQAQGLVKESLPYFRYALGQRWQLAQNDPGNTTAVRDLRTSLDKMGDVKLALDRPTEAVAYYRSVLKLSLRLLDADPKNVDAHRDVMNAYRDFARVAEKWNNFADARARYAEALAVATAFDRPDYFASDVESLRKKIAACDAALAVPGAREAAPLPRPVK